MQLEKEGLAPSAAVSRIREDGLSPANGSGTNPPRQRPVNNGHLVSADLLEELRARLSDKDSQLADLRSERDRLLSLLEDQGQQLRALTAGPAPWPRGLSDRSLGGAEGCYSGAVSTAVPSPLIAEINTPLPPPDRAITRCNSAAASQS